MEHPASYRGKKVIVLGLARSGQAVARCFHQFGAKVTVNDRKDRADCPEADELEAAGIEVICGHHPSDLITPDTALVVKNPGIPYRAQPVQAALEAGVEVVTEVEVAGWLASAPMIAITGSNGKTTTTTWLGRVFERSGKRPVVAGNIGIPLCEAVQQQQDSEWVIAEMSSFQLKGTRDFRPRVACLLNVAETHLDYHGTMNDYIHSKARIFANQNEHDLAVYNEDDPVCKRLVQHSRALKVPFSLARPLAFGAYLHADANGEEWIVWHDRDGGKHRIVRTGELAVPGRHNVQNALAVTAVTAVAGVDLGTLADELRAFRGVEHRLEFFYEKDGIRFYNNSKATNPLATAVALEAFSTPVVLVCGGMDRGGDFSSLSALFATKVKALIAIGEMRDVLANAARKAGVRVVHRVDVDKPEAAMEEAVELAVANAQSGDAVLLSPACASWDMFPSYEVRGRMFKKCVHTLIP